MGSLWTDSHMHTAAIRRRLAEQVGGQLVSLATRVAVLETALEHIAAGCEPAAADTARHALEGGPHHA